MCCPHQQRHGQGLENQSNPGHNTMHPAITTCSPALVHGSVRECFYSEERAWAWAGSGRRAAQEGRGPHTAAGRTKQHVSNVKCHINPRFPESWSSPREAEGQRWTRRPRHNRLFPRCHPVGEGAFIPLPLNNRGEGAYSIAPQ